MKMVNAQPAQKQLRAILVDDRIGLRSAMRLLLEQATGVEVIRELADTHSLPAFVRDLTPDLLLLDWELQELRSLRMRRQLLYTVRTVTPRIYIIGLCGSRSFGQPCIHSGVDAFVSKVEPPEILLTVVKQAKSEIYRFSDNITNGKRESGMATEHG